MAPVQKLPMLNKRDELVLFLYGLFADYYFGIHSQYQSTVVMVDDMEGTHYVTYEISAEEEGIYVSVFSDPDLEDETDGGMVTFHPRNEDEAEVMEDEDGCVPITHEMILAQVDFALELGNIGKTARVYEFAN